MANRSRHGSMPAGGLDQPLKADLPIDIVIIGASVAGLSCAYTLRQAGHNVSVFEAADDLGGSPGGVRIPPNMSRILFRWGLGPAIVGQTSGRCPKIVFHSNTGEAMGELVYHEEVMKELQAEVYFLHNTDLLQMLYNLAKGVGAKIHFGSRVVSIDPEATSIKLASGKEVRADLIVGADGHLGIARSVLDLSPEEVEEVNFTTYQFTFPVSSFRGDKDFLELVREPYWNLWCGSDWAVLGFGIRNNTEFSVYIFRNEKDDNEVMFDWRQRVPVDELDIGDIQCAPLLRRILDQARDVARVRGDRTTRVETWYNSNENVVAIGEAAHGWNPGSSHTAAFGVEDAVVLGRLLSRIKNKNEIGRFLAAYQEIRQDRCETVNRTEHQKVVFVALPHGPLCDERDRSMRAQKAEGAKDWSESEDSFLRTAWEEFRDAFGYDAYDDADTWWVEWGVIFERIQGAGACDKNIFGGQVVVEEISGQ